MIFFCYWARIYTIGEVFELKRENIAVNIHLHNSKLLSSSVQMKFLIIINVTMCVIIIYTNRLFSFSGKLSMNTS